MIWQLINKYDKISHFIGGFILGLFGLDWRLSVGLFVVKECFDTVKKNPTGFSNEDIMAGVGGWCVGNYVREIIK